MTPLESTLTFAGLGISGLTLAAILWSIWIPHQRLWPPRRYTWATPIMVWVPTFTLFGVIIALGVLDWGTLSVPTWLRFGIGPILIILGNLAVWAEVAGFGIAQTGGAVGSLKTGGLYRYSRNPQYVADSTMLIGWALLAASGVALPVIAAAIVVLLVAPFAEEPWLDAVYGQEYARYRQRVRRYL